MAAPWPVSLPQEPDLAGGYSEEDQDLTVTHTPDVGPSIVRARATAGVTTIRWTMIMDKTQRATLKTFRETTLGGGALPFELAHPITGVLTDFVFLAQPRFNAIGGGWFIVQMLVEAQP